MMDELKHLAALADGRVHLCKSGKGPQDIILVWTLCCKDVPANESYKSNESANCGACLEIKSLQSQIAEKDKRVEELEAAIRGIEKAARFKTCDRPNHHRFIRGMEPVAKIVADESEAAPKGGK